MDECSVPALGVLRIHRKLLPSAKAVASLCHWHLAQVQPSLNSSMYCGCYVTVLGHIQGKQAKNSLL